jgi:hypothetical protein
MSLRPCPLLAVPGDAAEVSEEDAENVVEGLVEVLPADSEQLWRATI